MTSSYPVRSGSLGGRFVADLLAGLTRHGWEFTVVTPAWETGGGSRLLPEARVVAAGAGRGARRETLAHGAGMLEELARRPWKWIAAPGIVSRMAETARRVLERERFDLVWSHWLVPGGLSAVLAGGGQATPHLATAHGGDVYLLERWRRVPGAGLAMRRLFRHTLLTAPVRHTAERLGAVLEGRRVRILPLPAGRAAGARPARAAGEILYLGRFEPVKGPDRLLAALRHLPAAARYRVTLAGSGSLEERLRAEASPWGERVRFAGALAEDGKREALLGASIAVFPSRRLAGGRGEGFPHAAMEALVLGVPIVAPRHGALGELVRRQGAGWVYDDAGGEERAARNLASALETALAAGDARVLAARRAGRRFHRDTAVAAWDRVLRRAARAA